MKGTYRYKIPPQRLFWRLYNKGFSPAFIRMKLEMNTILVKRPMRILGE